MVILTLRRPVLLPVYEFVITFDQEVAALWMRGRKLTLASLLLGSTRWCMVMSAVVISLPVNAMVRTAVLSAPSTLSEIIVPHGRSMKALLSG